MAFLDFLMLLMGCYYMHMQTEEYIHTDTRVFAHAYKYMACITSAQICTYGIIDA